jgi:hypothetical protein
VSVKANRKTSVNLSRSFRDVHRCEALAAESRAGQRGYIDIELAGAHLHGMLDGER